MRPAQGWHWTIPAPAAPALARRGQQPSQALAAHLLQHMRQVLSRGAAHVHRPLVALVLAGLHSAQYTTRIHSRSGASGMGGQRGRPQASCCSERACQQRERMGAPCAGPPTSSSHARDTCLLAEVEGAGASDHRHGDGATLHAPLSFLAQHKRTLVARGRRRGRARHRCGRRHSCCCCCHRCFCCCVNGLLGASCSCLPACKQ